MTEYWTPEEQGRIAEAAARVRQCGASFAVSVPGIGYVYGDGSVLLDDSVSDQPAVRVKFTTEKCIDYTDNTEMHRRAAEQRAAGMSPFVRLR